MTFIDLCGNRIAQTVSVRYVTDYLLNFPSRTPTQNPLDNISFLPTFKIGKTTSYEIIRFSRASSIRD